MTLARSGGWSETHPSSESARRRTVGPAEPGSNEHTLDQVRYDDFMLDTRTSSARDWFLQSRPTRNIGPSYPDEMRSTALAAAHLLRPVKADWSHGGP